MSIGYTAKIIKGDDQVLTVGNTLMYQIPECGDPTKNADSLQTDAKSHGIHKRRGEAVEWKTDSIKISVEDCGNYIQITKPDIIDSSCKISFRPEDVDIINNWLMEARSKALELQDSAINMANEGGPA